LLRENTVEDDPRQRLLGLAEMAWFSRDTFMTALICGMKSA
jgi:hypothetical protein